MAYKKKIIGHKPTKRLQLNVNRETLEQVSERINSLEAHVNERIDKIERQIAEIRDSLEEIERNAE